jgi:hypothetical protein
MKSFLSTKNVFGFTNLKARVDSCWLTLFHLFCKVDEINARNSLFLPSLPFLSILTTENLIGALSKSNPSHLQISDSASTDSVSLE